MKPHWLISLAWFAATPLAAQPVTARLPDYLCGGNQGIFADAFETGGSYSSDPSQGSGGAWPGSHSRTFSVAGFALQNYYLYVPPQYDPARPMPMLVVLHGAAGSHAQAYAAAQNLRDNWIAAADARGFIIVAPVSNGAQGGWIPADGSSNPDDYDVIKAAMADATAAYNIERNRISSWGFSAGGHVSWDMLLNAGRFPRTPPFTADALASFAVAGANSVFACSLVPAPCGQRFADLPRRIPVNIHIGSSDPNQPGAVDDVAYLLGAGWIDGDTLSYNPFSGGHTYTQAQLLQVATWACGFALQP